MLETVKYYYILCILIVVVSVKTCACQGSVEVQLEHGMVSGKVMKTFLNNKLYNVFKGIPYAEPPVGELRFKPPNPHSGWGHLYEAYKNKPTCVQLRSKMHINENFGISGSEDCLYLSVFTPSLKSSSAVMVFDYHDSYRTGFNGTRTYSPEFLAEEDIVVVSVSHRLGLLGYLTTEDDIIPANNGLRDYILALKWIKQNIKQFGGDPDRVTLMGSRGGGSLVNNLMYSKAAKGLFHAATIQSGTAHEPVYFPNNAREYAFKLANVLEIEANDSNDLLKELQKIGYERLVAKELDVIDPEDFNMYQLNVYPFSPIIENDGPEAIISTLPEEGKIVHDIPVMIGFNSRDGLELNSFMIYEPRIMKDALQDFFLHFPIRTNFRFNRNNSAYEHFKNDVVNYYLKDEYFNIKFLLQYSDYMGDVLSNYAINKAAKKLSAELESPTYYYMFDFLGMLNENLIRLMRNTRGSIETWGATIGDELCYLHLCSRIRSSYEALKELVVHQNEFKVLKKMLRLWSNFAKTGNPTPEDKDSILKTFKWRPIDKSSEDVAFAHITKALKMSVNPLGDREKFWDGTLKKYSEMVVDGVVQNVEVIHEEL